MSSNRIKQQSPVTDIVKKTDFQSHAVLFPDNMLEGLIPGASVAHNGCCLTVTKVDGNTIWFDLMHATLNLTNLGLLVVGDKINLERAAKFGDEIGGHAMSGHIMCVARVVDVIDSENNRQVWIEAPEKIAKYLFDKGYVGIDGISLTIGEVRNNRFCVNLIPETLQRTNMGWREVGDEVNIEVDPQTQAVVDTVERVLAAKNTTL
ncbi:riboflavin synthase subunit alpha [Enterovibrio nigricans]|uniref:Riboflavin synthase n=1 Tax=Enterovibrio nigricans DSM 22720 TaxID=1121868 RepID=A0A1T4VNK1_9GAMM|nr:riboflavin synthase subunit alpha [Enterovibrio nigricans]PKF49570.1 riboflavin synthase subunit alpha [Enterovibrio nigricans]SKA66554.1 riboflavin synthase alpha chain [Enterovibrio nigricans DSM 22720]